MGAAVEEGDSEVEEVADSAEAGEAEEEDQAVAPLQEFVPFSCPNVTYVC